MGFKLKDLCQSICNFNFCSYIYPKCAIAIHQGLFQKRKIKLNLVTIQLLKNLSIFIFSAQLHTYQLMSPIKFIVLLFFVRICSEMIILKRKDLFQREQKNKKQLKQIDFSNKIKMFYQIYISIIIECFNRMYLGRVLLQTANLHYVHEVILIVSFAFAPKLMQFQLHQSQHHQQKKSQQIFLSKLLRKCQSQWTLIIQIVYLIFYYLEYAKLMGLTLVDYILIAHFLWLFTYLHIIISKKGNKNDSKQNLNTKKRFLVSLPEKTKFFTYFFSIFYYPLALYFVQRHILLRTQNRTQIQIVLCLNVGLFLAKNQINQLFCVIKNKQSKVSKHFMQTRIFNTFTIVYAIRFSTLVIQFFYGLKQNQNMQSYLLYENFIVVYLSIAILVSYELLKIRKRVRKFLNSQ